MRLTLLPLLLLALGPAASAAQAEVELSFYGGWQGAPAEGVTIEGAPETSLNEGGGARLGARATWWSESDFGVALDYSHFGAGAEGDAPDDGVTLGGMDTLTLGGLYRWEDALGGATPYVGAGLGIARSDFEVEGGGVTSQVEATGAAASIVAGASLPIGDNWSVFGEYEGTYTDVEGQLEDGRNVRADGLTSSINLGVSFSF